MDRKTFMTRRQVAERFGGISDMTLWRWAQDSKLGFPKPTVIKGRKFYDLAEIEAWERARSAATKCGTL